MLAQSYGLLAPFIYCNLHVTACILLKIGKIWTPYEYYISISYANPLFYVLKMHT